MKCGVLLMNFGAPSGPEDVAPFLRRLFTVPEILSPVPAPLRWIVAGIISRGRAAESRKRYESIGGSPLLRWTNLQAESLQATLGSDYKVLPGMRVSRPSLEQGLRDLLSWGARELVLLPLFPQFSPSTSGACFSECARVLKSLRSQVPVRCVRSWSEEEALIGLWTASIAAVLNGSSEPGGTGHLLFSAHSLPRRSIDRGDPYLGEVERLADAVARNFSLPWSLAFQSAGSSSGRWLGPSLEEELSRLSTAGVRSVLVAPISFVSDHLETLWDLDRTSVSHAKRLGISIRRVPAFNTDPAFISLLAMLVRKADAICP